MASKPPLLFFPGTMAKPINNDHVFGDHVVQSLKRKPLKIKAIEEKDMSKNRGQTSQCHFLLISKH